MGGGKSGGGGEIPKEIEDAARTLRDIGEEQYSMGLPLMQQGSQQAQELLTTGKVNAMIPGISTAVETARANESDQFRNLQEQLTLQGTSGTALQEALAQGRMGAEQRVANIPNQFTLPFLTDQIMGPALGLPETGIGAIGQAGQVAGMAAGPQGAKRGGAGGALGGAASGAMSGAALGPWGMAAGAVIGGVMGSK